MKLTYNDSDLILAPIAGFSNIALRSLSFQYGVGLAYTEMVSAKGLYYKSENTSDLLKIGKDEKNTGSTLRRNLRECGFIGSFNSSQLFFGGCPVGIKIGLLIGCRNDFCRINCEEESTRQIIINGDSCFVDTRIKIVCSCHHDIFFTISCQFYVFIQCTSGSILTATYIPTSSARDASTSTR